MREADRVHVSCVRNEPEASVTLVAFTPFLRVSAVVSAASPINHRCSPVPLAAADSGGLVRMHDRRGLLLGRSKPVPIPPVALKAICSQS